MPPDNTPDLMASLLTPPGQGGISQVGLLGNSCETILRKVFAPIRAWKESIPSLGFGHTLDADGDVIDEALLARSPDLNIWEINCHGGFIPARALLDTLQKNGARVIPPMEFIQQTAGSVIRKEAAVRFAEAHTQSECDFILVQQHRMDRAVRELIRLISEDKTTQADQLMDTLIRRRADVQSLFCRVPVAVAGRPNAGKSSLVNALLGIERSVVSSTPGTTLDPVSEDFHYKGIDIRLSDTAGMDQNRESTARQARQAAIDIVRSAQLVLWVIDEPAGITGTDTKQHKTKNLFYVLNKCDLSGKATGRTESIQGRETYRVSAQHFLGIDRLWDAILNTLAVPQWPFSHPVPFSAVITDILHQCRAADIDKNQRLKLLSGLIDNGSS